MVYIQCDFSNFMTLLIIRIHDLVHNPNHIVTSCLDCAHVKLLNTIFNTKAKLMSKLRLRSETGGLAKPSHKETSLIEPTFAKNVF